MLRGRFCRLALYKIGDFMGSFRFYHIHDKYIRFLHSGDNRVQFNKGQSRPYVGVVLTIESTSYFVPLESPKPNHSKLSSSGPILKLKDGKLGIMGFNNMIPVPDVALIKFDFNDIEDEEYRMLLINQLDYCNSNREVILHRAKTTYNKAVGNNVPYYKEVCCNFKKLERMALSYNPNYRPSNKKKND